MWYSFRPYVPVHQRRAQAAREIEKRRKKGHTITPVTIEGRTIARTFWGRAWCDNLEYYSDFANRLPRGRSYVRNGSVVDLQIHEGKVTALVSGSSLYEVTIHITPLAASHWQGIKTRCAGAIGSLVELLQGRLSQNVMEVVTAPESGLFPRPAEIKLSCSCPDFATMCKHVAAVLYGVGARLDRQPELLFRLRKRDHLELIEAAVPQTPTATTPGTRTLAENELAGVFGIELAEPVATTPQPTVSPQTPAKSLRQRTPAKTASKAKRGKPTSSARAKHRPESAVAGRDRSRSAGKPRAKAKKVKV